MDVIRRLALDDLERVLNGSMPRACTAHSISACPNVFNWLQTAASSVNIYLSVATLVSVVVEYDSVDMRYAESMLPVFRCLNRK